MPQEHKLSVIIVGNNHIDYSLYQILDRLFKQIHNNKVPCAFLEEAPGGQSLIKSIECAKTVTQDINDKYPTIMQHSNIAPLDVNQLHHIALMLAAKYQNQLISGIISHAQLSQEFLDIYSNHAKFEKIKFYESLRRLDIYYTVIDLPRTEFDARVTSSCGSAEARNENELPRIAAMVKNIQETIYNKFKKGGIVIVSTGMTHAHRLGANLLLEHRKSGLNLNIDIQVFDCRAEYGDDFLSLSGSSIEAQILATSSVDSPEITEIYQTLPVTKSKISNEGQIFSAPLLEQNIYHLILSTKSTVPEPSHGKIRLFDITRSHRDLLKMTCSDEDLLKMSMY